VVVCGVVLVVSCVVLLCCCVAVLVVSCRRLFLLCVCVCDLVLFLQLRDTDHRRVEPALAPHRRGPDIHLL